MLQLNFRWTSLLATAVLSFPCAAIPVRSEPLPVANPAYQTVDLNIVDLKGCSRLSTLAMGSKLEDTQELDTSSWFIPLITVIRAFSFTVHPLPEGEIELRSDWIMARLDPEQLRVDPQLGLALSVQDLQTLLGLEAHVDTDTLAINLSVPQPKWQALRQNQANDLTLASQPSLEAIRWRLWKQRQAAESVLSQHQSGSQEQFTGKGMSQNALSDPQNQIRVGAVGQIFPIEPNQPASIQSAFGSTKTVRGGGTLRWGQSDTAALKLDAIYNEPGDEHRTVLLKLASQDLNLSANLRTDIDPQFRFQVGSTSALQFDISHASSSTLSNINWQVLPGLSFKGSTNFDGKVALESRLAVGNRDHSHQIQLRTNNEGYSQISLRQRLARTDLGFVHDQQWSKLQFSYALRPRSEEEELLLKLNHTLRERIQGDDNRLTTVEFAFLPPRSKQQKAGQVQGSLGVGWNTNQADLLTSVEMTLTPGLKLRGGYRGLSLSSDESSYNLEMRFNSDW